MSGESSFSLSSDEMDIVMSQMQTRDFEFDENIILVEEQRV